MKSCRDLHFSICQHAYSWLSSQLLSLQFSVISLSYLSTWTTWQWAWYISESKWTGFITSSLFFVNISVVICVWNVQTIYFLDKFCRKYHLQFDTSKGNQGFDILQYSIENGQETNNNGICYAPNHGCLDIQRFKLGTIHTRNTFSTAAI